MSSTPPNLWAGLSNPQRRTAVSHVLYFGMVGFGFVGSVAKLVNPSITLGLPILMLQFPCSCRTSKWLMGQWQMRHFLDHYRLFFRIVEYYYD